MHDKKRIYSFIHDYTYYFIILIIICYLLSIFAINLTGRVWVNYDIYSDAVLAKYMWQTKSLFPEGWHFGNQVYTVATPAVAAVFYGIVKDAYLALAIASCTMTLGILFSYIWCLKPFLPFKNIMVSLLVVIGGLTIGSTAHADWKGFQVFYTMASYYACYVIGIFITLGVFFRLANHLKVSVSIQLIVLIYNFALGMQSLREMLVLNLPLCSIVVLDMILHYKNLKARIIEQKNSYAFSFLALASNICGVFLTKHLTATGVIKQSTIISGVSSDIWHNFKLAMRELWDYIGLCIPSSSLELVKLMAALISIIIILITLIYIIIDYIQQKTLAVSAYMVIFFVISLLAVFCSGLFVISLRNIYYFCWYFLVAVSIAMLTEKKQKWLNYLKCFLNICLIVISIINYNFTFYQSFSNVTYTTDIYREIANQLQKDGIRYLYSDWRVEKNQICTIAYDNILYGTLQFSGNPEDLWVDLDSDCLYYEDWFEPENFEHAYIILSDYALYCLESEFSEEYRSTFMDNLEYVYSVTVYGEGLHFYLGSEKMYADMIH